MGQWNDGVLGGSDTGYNALVSWDLGSLLHVGHNFIVTIGYQPYGQNFYPPYGLTDADFAAGTPCTLESIRSSR